MTCHYCGLEIRVGDETKRRKEVDTYYVLHAACAQKWDNEARRL